MLQTHSGKFDHLHINAVMDLFVALQFIECKDDPLYDCEDISKEGFCQQQENFTRTYCALSCGWCGESLKRSYEPTREYQTIKLSSLLDVFIHRPSYPLRIISHPPLFPRSSPLVRHVTITYCDLNSKFSYPSLSKTFCSTGTQPLASNSPSCPPFYAVVMVKAGDHYIPCA